MNELQNRIIKYELIDWRQCRWLQPDGLKFQSPEQKKKLKTSLIANGFALPFVVWESDGILFILDGHHSRS